LLSKSEYRRQLYEADVSAKILDHIENRYDWKPSQFLPALYDGRALSSLVTGQYEEPTPSQEETEIGRALLLVFAEVALHRGLELPDHLPEPIQAAREVVTSLKLDGFDYIQGKVMPAASADTAETGPLVKMGSQIADAARQMQKENSGEPKVSRNKPVKPKRAFIGHGHSSLWRELKDFLKDRLKLDWDEFNREATAGKSTKERLEEMLREADFAFLVLTGEDEHPDGSFHPRENVIHEAGLFQGRLGFARAIILREDGCTEFSNIHGLTQIPFPKKRISAIFEEVRRVLEREGMLANH